MKVRVKGTHVVQLSKYPGEENCTQVLVLAGILTPVIAEKLKIREGCYRNIAAEGEKENWVPHTYASYPSPVFKINGAAVTLGEREFQSTLIHKFKIDQPKTGGDNDVTLELRMRLHFLGKEPLFAWLENVNKSEFTLLINASQQDLVFGDESETGEDVDEEEADGPCPSCNNKIPIGLGNTHTNGQKCKAVEEAPPLASARETEGKTPGRRKKGEADPAAVQ